MTIILPHQQKLYNLTLHKMLKIREGESYSKETLEENGILTHKGNSNYYFKPTG